MSTEKTISIEGIDNSSEYLTDSLIGIIEDVYDLDEVKTESLNEKNG